MGSPGPSSVWEVVHGQGTGCGKGSLGVTHAVIEQSLPFSRRAVTASSDGVDEQRGLVSSVTSISSSC